MTQDTDNTVPGFGIGAVVRMTGLSDHTLRVWERRYQAVDVRRGSNGRRIYEAADIEKFKLLKKLTDEGHSIGQIARESIEELTVRVESSRRLAEPGVPGVIRTAVLGDFLPSRFKPRGVRVGSLRVVVADNDARRFAADLRSASVDVLILEVSTVGADTADLFLSLLDKSGARRGIVVYTFANSKNLQALREKGALLLRSPLSMDEIQAAAQRAHLESASDRPAAQEPVTAEETFDWEAGGTVPPRRFTQEQLATLANAVTAVDCECPQHLAQLVAQLTSFEVYSSQCANRDDEDAQLHRYLHHQTAAARALIEESLHRVADTEGIDY